MESKFWVININIFFLLFLSILANGQQVNLSISDINSILQKKEFTIDLKKKGYYKVYCDNNVMVEIELPQKQINQLKIHESVTTNGKMIIHNIINKSSIELKINQAIRLDKLKKKYVQFQFNIPDEKLIDDRKIVYFDDRKKRVNVDIIWFNKVPKNMQKHTYINILTKPSTEFSIDNINYFNMPIGELTGLLISKYSVKVVQ